ncbi:MAG: hypothetical protein MJ196_09290 [Treponemataceae bacterium]|nr:hypothetical protein [Treponemataceae bacterium]
MAKQNESKFGNLSLGQIAKFGVGLCGKDALLQMNIFTDSEINDFYKEKCSYQKFRYTSEDSFFGKIRDFFKKLEDEFELDKIEATQKKSLDGEEFETIEESFSRLFYTKFFWNPIIHIAGSRPFENSQRNFTLNWIVRDLTLNTELNFKYISLVSSSDFKTVFDEFSSHFKTLTALYEEIETNLPKKQNGEKIEVARAIQKCVKENKNPTWNVFYALLKTAYQNKETRRYCGIFLDVYFYNNFKDSVEFLSIKKTDWLDIENFAKKFDPENYDPYEAINFCKSKVNDEQIQSIVKYGKYFDDLTKENSILNVKRFQNEHYDLTRELPHSICFFENWFCAKEFVFRFLENGDIENLLKACNWYKTAFEKGKYFAGKSLEKFILEAITVSSYYEFKKNPEQFRKRISSASNIQNIDTKTPLPQIVKNFYDFALAFDLVLNEMDDAYSFYYHCRENFSKLFKAESETGNKIQSEDLMNEMGIYIKDKKDKTDFWEIGKEKLNKVTDKNINNYLKLDHNVDYTPISFAIQYDGNDGNFNNYETVLNLLDESKFPSLDLNKPNTNNSYPIMEILTQFKTHHKEIEKEIIFKILERTEKKTLFTQTNRRKISILQVALDSNDFDVVKAIIDKMTDNGKTKFPNDFLISSDELSPLYYEIQNRALSKMPERMMNIPLSEQNINYQNLFVQGLSKDEKMANLQNIMDLPGYKEKMKTFFDEMQKNREENDNRILDLLIERTENVDDFKTQPDKSQPNPKHRQEITALFYAADTNDVYACEKLIENGADVELELGSCAIPYGYNSFSIPNSFIYRLISYKSWDSLEMFLTKYKEKASNLMHRKNFNMTPLVFFLFTTNSLPQNEKVAFMPRRACFIQLFIDCGSSLDEETAIGSARNLIF